MIGGNDPGPPLMRRRPAQSVSCRSGKRPACPASRRPAGLPSADQLAQVLQQAVQAAAV
jgi:hypothetical protein